MENENTTTTVPSQDTKSWWERQTGERLKASEKVFGIISLMIFLFVFYIALDANKYKTQVHVIEGEGKVGVNPTTTSLDFGDLSRGTTAMRAITITNDTSMPFFVSVLRLGSIGDLLKQDPNNFMLRKGEQKKMEFTVYMPASATVDQHYTGRIIVFKIPAPFL
ncbi:MAG: hypothetical protein AAB372_03190 [Patescibacteria group bacterium]